LRRARVGLRRDGVLLSSMRDATDTAHAAHICCCRTGRRALRIYICSLCSIYVLAVTFLQTGPP
jgi:hypothetical protein